MDSNHSDSPSKVHPVNYRAIADASGVGKSTVGRVLHGGGNVASPTREKVLRAAELLGYRPDPLLGALSRLRWPDGAKPLTATIAYLDTSPSHVDSRQAGEERRGITDRARQLGYAIDIFRPDEYPQPGSLSRVIFARGIQGVLVRAYREGGHVDLDWSRFHAVFVGPENDVPRVHNVQGDFRTALHLAVAIAVERGYRRPGLVLMNHLASGTNVPFRAQALYEREALAERFGFSPSLFAFDPSDKVGHSFWPWLRTNRPDVIISTNAHPFHWLTKPSGGTTRRALRVPKDVAFISLRSAPEISGLAYFSLREYEQGRQAVDLLHNQLQHGIIGQTSIPLRLLVPPKFVDGRSLPDGKPLCVPVGRNNIRQAKPDTSGRIQDHGPRRKYRRRHAK